MVLIPTRDCVGCSSILDGHVCPTLSLPPTVSQWSIRKVEDQVSVPCKKMVESVLLHDEGFACLKLNRETEIRDMKWRIAN